MRPLMFVFISLITAPSHAAFIYDLIGSNDQDASFSFDGGLGSPSLLVNVSHDVTLSNDGLPG